MKKWMYNALIILFSCVLVVSSIFAIRYFINSNQQKNRYEQLATIYGEPTYDRPVISDEPDTTLPTTDPNALVQVTDPKTGETVSLLPAFAELYTTNPDIVGWLSIPGTEISYPVMHTPDRENFYLTHDFDGQESAHGCLYARDVCNVFTPSDNITIYGHRMKDGSMFARLDKYMDKSFYEENPYIFFDTLTELHTYQIISVFLTTASVGEGFSYHTFVDAGNEAEYNSFVDTCKDLSLYDTGVDAQYGDKLITLSTCEYSQTNGRLVVVAKRIG